VLIRGLIFDYLGIGNIFYIRELNYNTKWKLVSRNRGRFIYCLKTLV